MFASLSSFWDFTQNCHAKDLANNMGHNRLLSFFYLENLECESWKLTETSIQSQNKFTQHIIFLLLVKILINSPWNVQSGLFKISEKLNNHLELWFSFQKLALNASSHVKHFVNEHVMAANQNIMESQTCLVSSGDNKKARRVW